MKGALVLPGGGTFPTAWTTEAPKWGVTEWGFHTCFDDGTPNTELNVAGVRGAVLDAMKAAKINGVPQNYRVRITRDTHWPGSKTDPLEFAAQLSADLTFLRQDHDSNGHVKQCSLGIDYEGKDGDWILAALREIRRLRPGRGVYWTPEPNQGGWIKNFPALVKFINGDPLVFVVAQTYLFDMAPFGTADGVRVNLWDAGIDRDKVELFYGVKDKPHPARWSGVLYDWNNLALSS